ncbi:MAG TPA: CoA transferase [Saprospiraceae bacterium]|nr:CoA transferase [Saprospiraceae bacterium]
MDDVFKNLKVVEIASVLAGPLVGSFFAELGANVIKIENKKTGGDPTRRWKLPIESDQSSISAYYIAANTGKKSIFLDLHLQNDLEEFYGYVKDADIFISNLNNPSSNKLKVDYNTLKEINPNIIYAQLFAYDYDDDEPGYDVIMQAECGYIDMTGTEKDLAKMPVAIIDILAAEQMKNGIFTALVSRTNHRQAVHVKVSMYRSAISALVNQATGYLMENFIPERLGTLHPSIAPYGEMMVCKDNRKILLAIGSDDQFQRFATVIQLTDEQYKKFDKNINRVKCRGELSRLLVDIFKAKTSEDWKILLTENRIPFGFVNTLYEVFSNSVANSMIKQGNDGEGQYTRIRTQAFKLC